MSSNDLVRVDTNILPKAKLIIVFSGLASALLVSFIDQNSIGVALPTIGNDLNSATTIAWAGTSSLIANTVFQALFGRLSDIFGRKVVFLLSVSLLAFGDLLCSFAKTGPQLYGFRGISGIGTAGITAMAMIITSDIVSLENRGKYQGILGSCVGMGNATGPFLAAAFVEKATWRALFWFLCPLATVSGCLVAFTLPPSKVHGDMNAKIKSIDYYGIFFSSSAILLLLIPISGGGTYFEWDSPMVISMLSLGGVCMILFILVEWKWAMMPMMPLRLFKIPAVGAILIQNFLYGTVYFSHLYYLPIYYQNVRGFSPLHSAVLIIPFVAAQSTFSISSGQYVSRMKRYGEVIWSGFAVWTLGCGLLLLLDRHTPQWKIVIFLMVEGVGVGNVFQPTLVAAQAHSTKRDRAVVIGVRNFLRSLGGAIGLAISSALFSNVLKKSLNSTATPLPDGVKSKILSSILKVPDLSGLSVVEKAEILDSYMDASRAVFTLWVPMIGACLMLCFLIKDRGLIRPEEKEKQQAGKTTEDDIPLHEESDLERQSQQYQKTPKK